MCVCVRVRACDAGPRGRGRSGHREPQGLYDGGAVVRIPGVGAGCGLAGCQVPGGGEAAEGRGRAEAGREGPAQVPSRPRRGVGWSGVPKQAESAGGSAGRPLASLPKTARQGQGRTRVKPVPTSCLVCLWDMARTAPVSERWTRLPGTSFTCPARRERGSVQQYRPRRSPNTIIGRRRKKVQGTAGRGSRVEGRGRRSEST